MDYSSITIDDLNRRLDVVNALIVSGHRTLDRTPAGVFRQQRRRQLSRLQNEAVKIRLTIRRKWMQARSPRLF